MVTGNLVLIDPLFVFTGSPLPPYLLSVFNPVPLSFLNDGLNCREGEITNNIKCAYYSMWMFRQNWSLKDQFVVWVLGKQDVKLKKPH